MMTRAMIFLVVNAVGIVSWHSLLISTLHIVSGTLGGQIPLG